jgi:hypothetical protein
VRRRSASAITQAPDRLVQLVRRRQPHQRVVARRGARARGVRAVGVDDEVAGDGDQPRAQVLAGVEAVRVPPGAQEDLLGEVLGTPAVVHPAPQVGLHGRGVLLDHGPEVRLGVRSQAQQRHARTAVTTTLSS